MSVSLSYRLGSTVPDYWVPFLPLAVNGATVQMQLAKMPLRAANHPMGRLLSYQPLKMVTRQSSLIALGYVRHAERQIGRRQTTFEEIPQEVAQSHR